MRNKPCRVIPVDPIISPFGSGEDKFPREDTPILHWSPEHPSTLDLVPKDTLWPSPVNTSKGTPVSSPGNSPSRPHQTTTPTESPKTPRSPVIPGCPTPCQDSVNSSDSTDSDSNSAITVTIKDLVNALTMTLKNINQSPTIPLPVFNSKKGEDPEDHILKVEDYFEIHEIKKERDKIKRFKDTLFEKARKWAQTLNYSEVISSIYHHHIGHFFTFSCLKYFFQFDQ